ncbi:hypothetical protein AWM79_18595 [Pseudomonas agarici]|uniref:Type I restriction modification DNA specificity domain-containing protein n=1 Tax=Pseudomonas agarici TaxID=46677 RepID=A0A0X1T502_PSEAA|nr:MULTISPECIES: restriction endonuclease subunit S [Pseudomonas]AMB87194.1 hypothetical protein AWM79_18595 [Pseudomonas agarici]MBK3481060.1 restriction endonuclease subunit S [Pseudomonas fluorescens]
MSLPTYPGYKDSGVDWLGTVPEHWDSKRLKFLFDLVKREIREEDRIVTCFRDGAVTLRDNRRTDGFTNAVKEIGYQGIRVGDLVIHAMDAFAGAIGVSDSDGKSTPVYSVCTPVSPSVSSNYYARLLRNMAVAGFVSSLAKGIRERSTDFRWADAGEIFLPVPSETEQRKIVSFLDHETARIDALIEEQQRLIELLKEKRQAVISHAVTKGLDPTVPMKDSGVEWLGEVPAHWDVARVKNVAKLESGHTPSKDFPEYWEGGDIPWVSLNDSKKLKVVDYIDETQFMITELGVSNSSARLLPARAVVFTRDASIGLAAITTKKMCVSQHLIAWICNESLVLPEYLLLVFYAMEEELDRFTFGATIKTIGMPDIRKLVTPVPPVTEQVQVVADVNAKRELIERLIQESNTALTLHSERRSALISAAVTGKIDVRCWQSQASAKAPVLEAEAV